MEEVDYAEKRRKMSLLMNNPEFRELILEDYVRDTALDVGTTFDGSDAEVDSLKAVSHFNMYVQSLLVEMV